MNRLKELRNNAVHNGHKMRQADLAELLGVTKLTVSNWENGKHEIKADKANEIANLFNVPVSYLLGYDDKLTVGDAIDILNAVSAGTVSPDDEIAQKIIERQKRTITNANLAMEQNYEKTKGFDLVSNVRFLSLLVEKYDKVCKDILFYVTPRIAKDELTDSELKALEEFIELFDSHFSDNQDDNNHTHDFIHEFLKQKTHPKR